MIEGFTSILKMEAADSSEKLDIDLSNYTLSHAKRLQS
jgi:hypothetical protein